MTPGAVTGDGFGNALQRNAVDHDVLVIGPSAIADRGQPGGLDEGKALAEHSGRGVELAELFPVRGAITGLFLELADRALDRVLAGGFVTDEASRKLEAELAERDAVLLDQDHFAVVDRQDHRRAHPSGAAGILPAAAPPGLDELAGP